jgi:hypothetical protein
LYFFPLPQGQASLRPASTFGGVTPFVQLGITGSSAGAALFASTLFASVLGG